MARRYAICVTATGPNSTTLPYVTLIGTTAIRPRIYDVVMGSVATAADNAARWEFQRCTTAGTAGSSVTPQALDPGDPAAAATSGLAVFSAGPTLTASAFVLHWSQNQRATFRWVAAPGGELVIPATANNGLALMEMSIAGSAVAQEATIHYEE